MLAFCRSKDSDIPKDRIVIDGVSHTPRLNQLTGFNPSKDGIDPVHALAFVLRRKKDDLKIKRKDRVNTLPMEVEKEEFLNGYSENV